MVCIIMTIANFYVIFNIESSNLKDNTDYKVYNIYVP